MEKEKGEEVKDRKERKEGGTSKEKGKRKKRIKGREVEGGGDRRGRRLHTRVTPHIKKGK